MEEKNVYKDLDDAYKRIIDISNTLSEFTNSYELMVMESDQYSDYNDWMTYKRECEELYDEVMNTIQELRL